MKKIHKTIKMAMVAAVLGATTLLTSCDIMSDVLSGMAAGMSVYNQHYTSSYSGSTNNSYLLNPNYAIWQTQQQQAQMNAVNQQLMETSVKQAEQQMKELERINQQLIETSIWQAEHGINLGGTEGGGTGTYNGGTGNGGNQGGGGSTAQPKQHQCGLCKGSGRTIKTNGTSFGKTKYCSECGKTVPDYHYHSPCESCKGKGWW